MKPWRGSANSGQAVVELALLLPVLLLCLFGTLDLGRAIYTQFTLANAVREGVRRAILEEVPNSSVVQTVVAKAIAVNLKSSDVKISNVQLNCYRNAGSQVTVSASAVYRPITPIISNIVGSSIRLSAQSSMTVE